MVACVSSGGGGIARRRRRGASHLQHRERVPVQVHELRVREELEPGREGSRRFKTVRGHSDYAVSTVRVWNPRGFDPLREVRLDRQFQEWVEGGLQTRTVDVHRVEVHIKKAPKGFFGWTPLEAQPLSPWREQQGHARGVARRLEQQPPPARRLRAVAEVGPRHLAAPPGVTRATPCMCFDIEPMRKCTGCCCINNVTEGGARLSATVMITLNISVSPIRP